VSLRGMLAEFPEAEQRQLISQLKRLYANLEVADKQELPEQSA
jgi:hypothetical protein